VWLRAENRPERVLAVRVMTRYVQSSPVTGVKATLVFQAGWFIIDIHVYQCEVRGLYAGYPVI
jgi:hypothetical protein